MNERPAFDAPLYVAWEVTRVCNARCVHCYSDSGPEHHVRGDLSTRDALAVIDQLADAGLLILAFSGGEPLIRRDIFELIAHAAQRGLVVNIASNGALVDARMARRLRGSGVRSVTISLDGADAATHDRIRRFPGLFGKVLHAIESLVAEDIRVVVSFTPMRINHEQGPAVVELAANIGASAVNMSEYVPAGRGTLDLALSPPLVEQVVKQWIELRRTYAGRLQIIWHDCRVALLVPPEERDRYSGCGAGKLTARLCVDATLTPCVFLPNAVGNLLETPFRTIWTESPLLHAIRDRTLHGGNCAACDHRTTCGGCRAVSMANTGDPLQGDASCWIHPEPAFVAVDSLRRRPC